MKKRILSLLLAVLMVIGMTPIMPTVNAASTLEEAMKDVNVYAKSQKLNWLTMNGSVKEQEYTYYLYQSVQTGETKEIPAYCVDPRLYGVPWIKDHNGSVDSIRYSAESTVSDPKICGIISNGYPHMSLSDLGLQSVDEAYYATKTAVWIYLLGNWSVSGLGVNPNLSGADKEAAQRVLQATKTIYQRGMNWSELVSPKLTATPDRSTAYATTINGEDCYQQIFTIDSNTWALTPVLLSLDEGAPAGTKIMSMDNDEISQIKLATERTSGAGYQAKVKVVYPKSSIEGETGTCQLILNATVVEYKLFYAHTLEADKYGKLQNYILDTDPDTPATATAISSYSSDPDIPDDPDDPDPTPEESTLKIIKLEEGTDKPLAGAEFRVLYPDGSVYGVYHTDSSGMITLPIKVFGNYTVSELVPPRYHLLPTHTTQNVTVTATQGGVLTFYNAPYGNLRVHKISNTGDNLDGVTITIKNLSTGETRTAQTAMGGVAEFTELAPNGYEVKETAGIEGYILDGEATQTATVVAGETSEVTFVNKEKPGLRIVKYDRTTLQTMADVTFEIFKDGASIGRYTTDQMGEIVFTNAEPGTYLVKEAQSVDSHITDTTPQETELKAGDGIRQLVFYNDRKPGIHLVKVDSADLSKPIANAKFSIRAVDGSYGPEEFTTGADGTIDLSKLPTGAYVVTELFCPGYVIDEAQRIIQLDGNETAEFVFTNSIRPTIHIVKISSDGSPLPGVAFRIAKIEDGSHYLDRTTDENGEILINDLDPGVYSVRETSTVADHVLDLREFHVELFPGRTSTLVVENQKRPNLIVYKHDADTGEPIADTVFTVRAADGHSVDEIKTGADGKAELYNLLPGVYEISEKSVPADWLLDAPSQLVTLYANRDHTVYFENHRKPTLTVNKVSSVTGKALEGAKFNVTYASNNTTTGEINDLGTFYTDENGQFTLTRLRDGWYKVTELASVEGYQPADVKTDVQSLYVGGGDNAVLTFENVPLSAITVYKYDSVTGEAVSNAVFEIRYLTDSTGSSGTAIGRYKTGVNGSFTVTGLIKGTYIVEELASDDAHVIDTAPQTVFLSGEDQDVAQLYFGNTPKGSVLITKKDAVTMAPLSGVEFTVTDSIGALLGSANGKFTTDASGSILIENLEPSVTVVAKESRTISGYVLDNTPQTVKVQPGKTVTIEFLNQPKGNLVIRKFDSVTKEPLPGAEFKVTTANGELTPDNEGLTSSNGLYTTDKNGQITLSKLTPATYVISESRAPDGYALDNQTQTVVVNAGDTQTVSFYDEPLATLMLLKRDAVSKRPLANAEFTVKTVDGTAIGTNNGLYTTDESGTATVTGIQPNTAIVVSEESAPAGYVANATPKTIVVKSGVANSLTFDDEPTTTLIIHKYVEGTANEPLSGVGFRVTDSTGAAVGPNNGTYYTDRAGEIMLTGIAPGITVTAQEFKTVDGYVLDGTPQSVLIKDYQKMELTFWNARQGSLTIRKLDSITKEPLAGAEFKLAYADGRVVDNANGHTSSNGIYVTDANGEIRISGVTGTIVVTEEKAPAGHLLDPDNRSQTVVVNADDAQVLTFYNPLAQSLTIKKFAAGTTDPIEGVRFKITGSDGAVLGNANGEFTTDRSGQITLAGLTPGVTVTAQEIETVSGFVLNSTPQSILIKSGEAQELVFYNEKKGALIIEKRDSVTDAPLSGAEFLITTIDGTFVDDNEGATSTQGIYKTDTNGQIVLRNLQPNTYVARETKAPEGYVLDGEKQTVKVNAGDTQTITFTNTPLQNVVIEKYAEDTGEPLSGVTFLITDSAGNPIGSANGEHTTDANGRIVLTGLVPGTAVVAREVRTVKGYVLNGRPQTIVAGTGAASRMAAAATSAATASSGGNTLKFYDAPLSTLVVTKYVAGTTTPIQGVRFLITGSDGGAVGNTNGEYTTDADGRIVLKDLQPGITITAKEIEAAEGFVPDGTPKSIEIKSGDVQELYFYNSPTGSLTIIKKDRATGAALKGATFQLTYANGEFVGNNGGKTTSNGSYTTDENGQIIIKGLQPSTITIRETKAPDGYSLNDAPVTVEIKANDAQTIEIFNDAKQTLTIQKFVTGTTDPIQGVKFLVTDSTGAALGPNSGEYTTDKNGCIILTGLEPGVTVTAKETATANGFVLDTTPQSILIKQGESQTLTFYNTCEGGLELIKVDAADKGKRIPNTTFEIRKMDQGLVTTVTTDKSGRVHVDLDAGDYYAVETEAAIGYQLDATPTYFTITDGKTTTVTVANKAESGILIHKIDASTGKGIPGVTFLLYDGKNNPVGQYTSDDKGYVRIEGIDAGRYRIRELENKGYVPDTGLKTVEVKSGETTLIEWKNIPITAQIQITKKSADYNPVNGLPAGTLLEGAVFEIYDKASNLVDTIKSDNRGLAVSRALPLGRYTIREVKAPANYGVNETELTAYLEHEGQIVRFEVTNKSLMTGVSITKTGPKQVMQGQPVRYQFSKIGNTSNVRLDSYYWRDTLPSEVTLESVTTGTYNFAGTYKITYRVNGGEPKTLADNLSTSRNYTLAASPVALGLAADQRVTEIMFVFGQAPAGFAQVEAPSIACTVRRGISVKSFVNVADIGGVYNGQWVQGVSRWVTEVYSVPTKLPRTGY